MSFDLERLWELLPAIYRIRDAELASASGGLLDSGESNELSALRAMAPPLSNKDANRLRALEGKAIGGPLRALFAILAEQVAVIDENLDQLYDDLFIETCAEWVVPYIGDLVGARGVSSIAGAGFTNRAQVADTIKLRRRKGTASMLEQLARDITSWDAVAVEYFQLLATTQYLNHLRPQNLAWASLRHDALAEINTPFDRVTHNAEIRNIATAGGKYNIPNIGIHLFRIGAHPVTSAAPFPPNDGTITQFFFDPLGRDMPLFNRRDETVTDTFDNPFGVSRPISREAMYRDLAAYYGSGKSILINIDGHDRDDVVVCDLSAWGLHPQTKIAIDPELGRFKLPGPAQSVRVSYFYGAPSNLGGGEYDRASTFENDKSFINKIDATSAIQSALDDLTHRWSIGETFERGIVEINANDFFIEAFSIDVPAKKIVEIRASDGKRPMIVLRGAPQITGGTDSQVVLSGLLLTGESFVVPQSTSLALLRIVDCTLAPRADETSAPLVALTVAAKDTKVEIERSISGPLRISELATADITGSIIDALGESNLAYGGTPGGPGGPLTIENSTVIGRVETRLIELASNVIFSGTNVTASQVQEGCVRFSYVPPRSHVPRRFQCQPSETTPGVRPRFVSRVFGNPAYCQLSASCPIEIRAGAADAAEMGVYHDLYQPQREANLRARLDEYLRFGLEAGIFYAS
jgi:hypothetical protein